MAKLNDWQKIWNFAVVKPGTWLVSQIEGVKEKAPTEAELTALGEPVVALAETKFETAVSTLLTADPSLTEAAIAAKVIPTADAIIVEVISEVKTTNAAINAVEQYVEAYVESLVPTLVQNAYNAVTSTLKAASTVAQTG